MLHQQRLSIFISVVITAVGAITLTSALRASGQARALLDILPRLEGLRATSRAADSTWPASRERHLKLLRDRAARQAQGVVPKLAITAEGTITGTITEDGTGTPLDIEVVFFDDNEEWVGSQAAVGGHYVATLPAGSYYVLTSNTSHHIDELHPDVPPPLDFAAGALVEVVDSGTMTVDFSLTPGFGIQGTVTDAATLGGIDSTRVFLKRSDWQDWASGATGNDGGYSTSGVPPGEYYAVAIDSGYYVGEAYDNVVCPEFCDLATVGATVITVTGPGSLGIDFALDLGGVIVGHFTDQTTGEPLNNIGIDYFKPDGDWFGANASDETGTSWSPALPVGSYKVRTSNLESYLDELYNDIPCVCGLCEVTTGDDVAVIAEQETDVHIALDSGHQITGTITDADTGGAISDGNVSIVDSGWNQRGWGVLIDESTGEYLSCALPEGSYYAIANHWTGYVPELYDNVPCPDGWNCHLADGTPIPVGSEPTPAIVNFELDIGGTVCGRVSDAVTGAGLGGVLVQIHDTVWDYRGSAWTDDDGAYTVVGLTAGSLYAATFETGCYIGQVWDGVLCPGGWSCEITGGTALPVVLGGSFCDIDFALTQGGTISGTAVDADASPAFGSVDVFDLLGTWVTSDSIEPPETGDYATPALPTGNYLVTTRNDIGRVDELFDDLPLPWTDLADGTLVPVTVCAETQASFMLDLPGTISGSVQDAGTTAPLSGEILFYGNDGAWLEAATLDDGNFVSPDLPQGDWYAVTLVPGYVNQAFDGVRCEMPTCDPTAVGQPLAVSPGTGTSGVNFLLAPWNIFGDGFESGDTSAWSSTVGN